MVPSLRYRSQTVVEVENLLFVWVNSFPFFPGLVFLEKLLCGCMKLVLLKGGVQDPENCLDLL